ncbi:type II toxin-antitoxin system VapC family toxin [Mucilaginibacter sp. NFX135]|uniref:type II toxin-antitoxin system VapC family toxin n=1 Tax=Mucilaginibacter sp. NFX135 TaxID=3402687 RepID=UPI003AFA09D9
MSWDTNAVIYYLQNDFSEGAQELMNNIINEYQPAISVITEIELLCWKTASENDIVILKNFVADSFVIELENSIKVKTIEMRKSFNLKLPDAIIAATAICMNLILISNDRAGFQKIPSLKLNNPFVI